MKRKRSHRGPRNSVGNVAELFAGVGGFRLGLEKAGWKTQFSNQWEPSTRVQHASLVYIGQFGSSGHSNEDIASVSSLPPGIDLLVGGFPCQDYSVAKTRNSAKGLEGKKGVLWWEILRLVKLHKPRFIFLENVDRLLKSPSAQKGRDFAVMLKSLGDAGYTVEWRVVNAADYGFPQRRVRVFIVATSSSRGRKVVKPADLIAKTGILARALPIRTLHEDITEFEIEGDLSEISAGFNRGRNKSPFYNSGCFIDGRVFTIRTVAKSAPKRKTLGSVLLPDSAVPPEYWISPRQLKEWRYQKGAKSIARVHKASGFVYKYAEGKMAFPDALSKPSRTILTGEGGASPSRFKHIIKKKKRYRRLTPIELERLNGFPDDWTKFDCHGNQIPDTRRAFFMGNALVVGLVERVGKVLAEEMRKSR